MFTSSYRVTKSAFQNFWRNFWLSVITISMLVLTLLTVNVLLVLNVVTEEAIDYVEDRIEVSVYFNEDVVDETVQGAVTYLRGFSQVRDVETISADESLERFRLRHENDEAILQSLTELETNPFGPTLVVKAHAAADFEFIIDALDNPQFRDAVRDKDFSDYEEIINKISDTTDRIQYFGILLTAIFLLIAILIIFNTVKIGLFIHREEIGIMKLVGATNWFVRAPFLLESIVYSFLSLLIVIAVMFPTVAFLEPRFGQYFGGETIELVSYFEQNALAIFGLQLIVLILVNIISTSLAMRKYLKV